MVVRAGDLVSGPEIRFQLEVGSVGNAPSAAADAPLGCVEAGGVGGPERGCLDEARSAGRDAAPAREPVERCPSLFGVAGGNSTIPPYVHHRAPEVHALARELRSARCTDPSYSWCSSAPSLAVPDLTPILVEESAVVDQARAREVGVGAGHGSAVKKKRAFRVIHHATRNVTLFVCLECNIQYRKHGSIDRT